MSKEHDEGKEKIKRLRIFYKRNFVNGDSDRAFLAWIETMLNEIRGDESAAIFHTTPKKMESAK